MENHWLLNNAMENLEDKMHAVNRKPKFVEIPSVPSSEEDAGTGSASSTSNRLDKHISSELDEPDPTLMAKLGLFLGEQRVSHVKTTNHIHPMLSHNNIGGHASESTKKQTISPASTLSDKGIGSSVGSFDSEFRNSASVFLPSVPFSTNKTGSLDSRTQDLSMQEKPLPSHSRSSSDIICQSGASGNVSQAKLAEQSSVTLWNSDPRRGNKLAANSSSSSLTSSIRPRRLSTRRQRSVNESPVERDAEVKKLPQLCRDSPSHSTRSSISSSSRSITPAVSVCEMVVTKSVKTNGFSSEPLPPPPPPPEGVQSDCGVRINPPIPPSPHGDIAPPLPPKASHLKGDARPLSQGNSSTVQQDNLSIHNDVNRLYPFADNRSSRVDDSVNTASSTLTSRLRLSSDGALRQPNDNVSTRGHNSAWSQDARRESSVAMTPGRQSALSTSMGGYGGIGRAESLGGLQNSADIRGSPKLHGSTSALWDTGRPHSVSVANDDDATVICDDDTFKRQNNSRSSTRSNPGERRRPTGDAKVRFAPYRPPEVSLKALQFDLPQAVTSEIKFVGREWMFNEILAALASKDPKTNKGMIITGAAGHGKTAIVEHLVSYSYHGWKNSKQNKIENDSLSRVSNSLSRSSSPLARQVYYPGGSSNQSSRTGSPAFGSTASSRAGSLTSLTEDASRKIASQIVAFHFCQSDNNTTCYVPEFIHSIAAQLTQAPQLTAYRELLINEPHLQNLLSVRNCIQNPSQALHKAILEPLVMLKRSQKLPRSNLIILIDGLNEAEQYLPDYGFSIMSFLREHLKDLPEFIKVVATCRSEEKSLVENLPVHFASLDCDNPRIVRDMQLYVSHRVSLSSTLSNITLSGKSDPNVTQKQLSQHLLKTGSGNFLFLRMTLDLIDQGAIVPKSAGFKVVPVSLHEVFLLQCNLRFMSYTSFDEVRDVIAVALASLYPLKDEQLYQAVCSGLPPNHLPWTRFKQQMELIDGILVQGSVSAGRTFFHPCFRGWLLGHSVAVQQTGTLQSPNKFKVDVKRGYALLATVLSRQPPERLHKHATLELAHHVLKAGMFKNQSKQTGMSASEHNAHFVASTSKQLTEALISTRNLFYPNMKVSKLLLRAGANPNANTQVFSNAPPLGVVSHTGCMEFAELLLMFGADVNQPAANGMSALTFAAAAGRLQVVELLLRYRPALSQVDHNGHTPLLHAISRGHSNVAKLLLSCNLYTSQQHQSFAAQQALVATATTGDIELMKYLFEREEFQCDVNGLEPSHGESPLTSAAAHGKSSVCEFLVRHCKASLNHRNRSGLTPLLCAVKHGEWDSADHLLNFGSSIEACDAAGKTPLIMAACHGHLGVLELLLSRGANVHAADREGLTALSWSALQGHSQCVRSLIGRSNIHHSDVSGRTALDLAAFFGDPQIVDLLLDAGSDIAHVDASGMCALDRAIGCQNIAVVARLLCRGAQIQTTSWAMAIGKPDVTAALLNKSLEDGNNMYKKMDFVSASDIYARALKHVGELSRNNRTSHQGKLADLCAHLLLGYSRCMRKVGDLEGAEASATRALDLKPRWYEALYARARVLREASRLQPALCDVIEAERSAPQHNLKEIKRLIDRIKDEIRKGGARPSRPPSASSEIISVPHQRPRLNSSSSYHGNPSRGSSPSPAELSRSFQPRHHGNRLTPLYGPEPHMGRGNSQESLAESMISLSMYPTDAPVRSGSVRRMPRTNPHWRPHLPDLNRSVSLDNRNPIARYRDDDDTRSLCAEHPSYRQNGHTDVSRASFVTDL